MNIQEYELMNILADERYKNQRELSEKTGYSLGKINSALKTLVETGYLDGQMGLTKKAGNEMEEKRPKNAVILAAGFGMRMVPINVEVPKGILEVHGEPLIERLIRQLLEAGVIAATIDQEPGYQGSKPLDILFNAITNGPDSIREYYYTNAIIKIRSNLSVRPAEKNEL